MRGQRWLWVDRTVFTDGALTCDRELGSDIGVRENPIWRMETGVVCIGRGHISADERGRENERSKRVRLTGDRGRPRLCGPGLSVNVSTEAYELFTVVFF